MFLTCHRFEEPERPGSLIIGSRPLQDFVDGFAGRYARRTAGRATKVAQREENNASRKNS